MVFKSITFNSIRLNYYVIYIMLFLIIFLVHFDSNAKSCGAVKHCIKSVWEKQHVPEDTDSICQICLDMVIKNILELKKF